jgi:hypothetical protein
LIDHDRSQLEKIRHARERRLTQIFVFVLSRGMEENGASTRPPPARALPPSSPTASVTDELTSLRLVKSASRIGGGVRGVASHPAARSGFQHIFGRSASRSVAVFRVDDVSGLRAATLRTDPSPSTRTRGF